MKCTTPRCNTSFCYCCGGILYTDSVAYIRAVCDEKERERVALVVNAEGFDVDDNSFMDYEDVVNSNPSVVLNGQNFIDLSFHNAVWEDSFNPDDPSCAGSCPLMFHHLTRYPWFATYHDNLAKSIEAAAVGNPVYSGNASIDYGVVQQFLPCTGPTIKSRHEVKMRSVDLTNAWHELQVLNKLHRFLTIQMGSRFREIFVGAMLDARCSGSRSPYIRVWLRSGCIYPSAFRPYPSVMYHKIPQQSSWYDSTEDMLESWREQKHSWYESHLQWQVGIMYSNSVANRAAAQPPPSQSQSANTAVAPVVISLI
jgi:hypothetical protein